jgi:hypothetical protein
MGDIEKPFSPRTLALHWEVKAELVMKLCRLKKIRCFQVGREYRITPAAVKEYEAGECEDTGSADTGESGAPSGMPMAEPIARVLALKRAKRTARRLVRPLTNGSPTSAE